VFDVVYHTRTGVLISVALVCWWMAGRKHNCDCTVVYAR
jgi:hypothetical protein